MLLPLVLFSICVWIARFARHIQPHAACFSIVTVRSEFSSASVLPTPTGKCVAFSPVGPNGVVPTVAPVPTKSGRPRLTNRKLNAGEISGLSLGNHVAQTTLKPISMLIM